LGTNFIARAINLRLTILATKFITLDVCE
jgi:hypothetical protein